LNGIVGVALFHFLDRLRQPYVETACYYGIEPGARVVVTLPSDPQHGIQISDKPPLRDDTRFASARIAVFQYSAVAVFLLLISGFWRLQVQNPQFYDERAQANSIKSVPIPGPRGRILDRDGRVIVDNHSSFSLILAREQAKEEHLRPIAQGLDLDYNDLNARVQRMRKQPKYVPIVIKNELTPGDIAFVESHRDFFPELVRSNRSAGCIRRTGCWPT